jgi:Cu(I)-responsive transcriptional regulator
MSRLMIIGEAADAAGVSAKMIRHYEQIGLVPSAARTESGYRQYSERDVSILRFIRQSRRLGFSMEQIADLLGLWSDRQRASREVKALAQGHLDALEQKMRELAEMQQALRKLVASCHGDDDPHCAILDELAIGSSQAPGPGAVGGKPLRGRPAAQKAQRGAKARAPATSTQADLMAWTRAIHAGPGNH